MTPRLSLSFSAKLLAIVGIAAFAFVALVVASALLGNRVEGHLTTIRERYLPRIELGPELDGQFERLRRSYQDAVAIRDTDELGAAEEYKRNFLSRLEAARGAVDPEAAAELRAALNDYCAAANDVSRRLIAGDTGEGVVDAEAAMQKKQVHVSDTLDRAAALDRRELAEAFASSTRAEQAARTYQIWIGLACLAVVLALSLALIRSLLRAVDALAAGLQRFGNGNFELPIAVTSRDELGRVASRANEMANSLDRLGKERDGANAALVLSNRELEAFSYSVAHDLRAPLRGINGLSRALIEDYGSTLDGEAKDYLSRIAAAALRMGELIDALLALSRVSRAELRRETVDMNRLFESVIKQLQSSQPDRSVAFVNEGAVVAHGDPVLLRAVLENLISNAWKFTNNRPNAQITFGSREDDANPVFFVRDNGAGFDMAHAEKLFAPFQRLHDATQFPGTGIGLATVERIVHRHGGRIWAEGAVEGGATFQFTLPTQAQRKVTQ